MAEIKTLKDKINPWKELLKKVEDLEVLYEMAVEDSSMESELSETVKKLQEEYHRLEILNKLSGPVDKNGVFLSVHSGAGGTESCDWASMLMRMHTVTLKARLEYTGL